jgi:hypothetical protein
MKSKVPFFGKAKAATPAQEPVEAKPYGLMAEFASADELFAAARSANQAGFTKMDAFSPFPIEGLAEEVGFHHTRLPLIVLIGGITGALTGLGMQSYSFMVDYPVNVGGRPFFSWPAFVPITFELMILLAAFGAVFGMFLLNGLPRLYHPVFNAPRFDRATQDAFFLCIEADDPKFDLVETRSFLEGLKATAVSEVSN